MGSIVGYIQDENKVNYMYKYIWKIFMKEGGMEQLGQRLLIDTGKNIEKLLIWIDIKQESSMNDLKLLKRFLNFLRFKILYCWNGTKYFLISWNISNHFLRKQPDRIFHILYIILQTCTNSTWPRIKLTNTFFFKIKSLNSFF